MGDVHIEKVLVSNMISFCEKTIYTLLVTSIMIINLSHYKWCFQKPVRYDGQNKWMYFLIEDDKLLEKYNTIWDRVSADIKTEFDRELVYKNEFLKVKIKSHNYEVRDFYSKNTHTCLAVLGSIILSKKMGIVIPKRF